jgi:copper oxidase (laccase) domain-containing protein
LNPHQHPDWLIPQWPAPEHVRAVFTTRAGGCSPAPWDSLNLGDHVGDAPARVADNRQTLARATGCQPVFVQQVHGQQVVVLEPASADLSGQVADAAVTRQRGLGCTIMVADCLPVLLAHLDAPVVAAAHAGWRGLAGQPGLGQNPQPGAQPPASAGVLAAVFSRFSELAGQSQRQAAGRTIAWLGPCIGPAAFEVGAEVKAVFEAWHPGAGACFVALPGQPPAGSTPKYLADLAGLARLQLHALGIAAVYGNDSSTGWCTVSQASRFFSHRRDAGGGRSTGRMAACIWQV